MLFVKIFVANNLLLVSTNLEFNLAFLFVKYSHYCHVFV